MFEYMFVYTSWEYLLYIFFFYFFISLFFNTFLLTLPLSRLQPGHGHIHPHPHPHREQVHWGNLLLPKDTFSVMRSLLMKLNASIMLWTVAMVTIKHATYFTISPSLVYNIIIQGRIKKSLLLGCYKRETHKQLIYDEHFSLVLHKI